MDRIIEVKVNGNYLFKDNNNAGVQYEANVTSLRIEFDAGWDGYAKKVTFWDAVGGNPVELTLTTDLLEDITSSTRIYLCPIPGEPMLIAGNMTFVIDGYVDGKRQRSISDKLRVKEAPFKETAGEPADPTPTQAEQLQAEIDRIQSTIQNAAQSAEDARASAEAAKNSEIVAESAKDAAETALVKAEEAQAAAESAKTEADAAIATVESAKNAAVAAADNAKASETAAKGSEEAAKASETAAESAKTAAETAKAEAEAAKSAAEKANANAGIWAYNSAENGQLAEDARVSAQAAQAAAEAAQAGAEAARDQASEIAGGDFATKTQAQGYANTAEGNAKAYTDQQIAAIPTPDVSGQISEHNTDTGSHSDIRLLISGLTERLNALANSDDTTLDQMAEVVAYIKDNRGLIEQITTGKVSVSDIIDDLTTNVSNKPLSAAQGVALKALVDTALSKVDGHTHTPESIGAAPAYTYGTEDLIAGESPLETGKLYFVFE